MVGGVRTNQKQRMGVMLLVEDASAEVKLVCGRLYTITDGVSLSTRCCSSSPSLLRRLILVASTRPGPVSSTRLQAPASC